MKVIIPGHEYELDHIDGSGKERLVFVNRESGSEKEGTQSQELLRALINATEVVEDRTCYLDDKKHWTGNKEIIKNLAEAKHHLRLALFYYETRAAEMKIEKGAIQPEALDVGPDGHWWYSDAP